MTDATQDDTTEYSTEDYHFMFDKVDDLMSHNDYGSAITDAASMFVENDHTADASPDEAVELAFIAAQDVLDARTDLHNELVAEVAEVQD